MGYNGTNRVLYANPVLIECSIQVRVESRYSVDPDPNVPIYSIITLINKYGWVKSSTRVIRIRVVCLSITSYGVITVFMTLKVLFCGRKNSDIS